MPSTPSPLVGGLAGVAFLGLFYLAWQPSIICTTAAATTTTYVVVLLFIRVWVMNKLMTEPFGLVFNVVMCSWSVTMS